MKSIHHKVKENVNDVLNREKLFRYDCDHPVESEASLFEKKFAETVGSTYAVAMNSCSSALYVSLLCAGVRPGDKVAVPAFTFIAVPSAIVHAGAQPVLIEVDENYVMDLEDFERKVQSGEVRVLLLSYMRGRVPDLDKVIALCNHYDITLLEDSAHSLGILWNGVQTGTLGLAGAFSAQSYKIIDSGEGGILVTNSKKLAFKAMLYAGCYEHNWKKHFDTQEDEEYLKKMTSSIPAYNFRMSNITAALLTPQLDNIQERVQFLNEKYERLTGILSKSKYIRIPVFTAGIRPAADSIQWEFEGLNAEEIASVRKILIKKGIKIEVFTGSNARCFWNWTFFTQNERCSFTKDLLQRTVDMRLRLFLSTEEIDQMAQHILESIDEVMNMKIKLA